MTPFDLLRLILATWWIGYALSSTSGPFEVFKWIREHVALGGLTACIICLTPWVALILILLNVEIVLNVFAVAGGACLLHGYTGFRYNTG